MILIPKTDFVNIFSLSVFFVLIFNSHYICRFFPQIKTPAPNVARAGGSDNAYSFLLFAPMKKLNPAKTGAPVVRNLAKTLTLAMDMIGNTRALSAPITVS